MNKGAKGLALGVLFLTSSCKWVWGKKNDVLTEKQTLKKVQTKSQKTKTPVDKIIEDIKTENEFDEKILKAKKPVIVKFHASWCGACRAIQPLYEKLAKEHQGQYNFTTIDITKLRKLSSQYNVKAIPTFLFFQNGEVKQHLVGVRKEKVFKKTIEDSFSQKISEKNAVLKNQKIKKQVDVAIENIKTMNGFDEKVLKAKKPVIVKLHASWCGACRNNQPLYEQLAKEHQDNYTFAAIDIDKVKLKDLASQHNITGIRGIPAFLFFKNGKEIDKNQRIIGDLKEKRFRKKIEENFSEKTI